MTLRRSLVFMLAAVLVVASCGGGDSSSSPRQRNSATGLPCISSPEYKSNNGQDTVSVVLCDEADAVYYDGQYIEPDSVTRRVLLPYTYDLNNDLRLNATSVKFLSAGPGIYDGVSSVSQDTIDVDPKACNDGGLCRVGEMINGVGIVIARVGRNDVLVLAPAALNATAMRDSYVVGNSLNEATGVQPSVIAVSYSTPSGVRTVDASNTPVTMNGDFNTVESWDGFGYGRFGTPRMFRIRPFFYSPAGQLLLAYMRDDANWYLPSRIELREAFAVLGSTDSNPEGFTPGHDYLTSTVEGVSGLMWARSLTEEKTVTDGAAVRIRPMRLHTTPPVEATFNIQNTFREQPQVQTTTPTTATETTVVDESTTSTEVTDNETEESTTSTTETTVSTTDTSSATDTTISTDAEPVDDETLTRTPITVDDLAIASVSARGSGLRRMVSVNLVSSVQSLWERGYAVSLTAETSDGDVVFAYDVGGSNIRVSAVRFKDGLEYRFYLRAVDQIDGTLTLGEWVGFTPNAEPLDRSATLQPPANVVGSVEFSALYLTWNPTHSVSIGRDAFVYVIRYGKVGGTLSTTAVDCCSTNFMLTQFEEGVEYEFSVATALVGSNTVSEFSAPLRVTPLRRVDPAERDRLLESCRVNPEVSLSPTESLSTRSKVTITVTHPCIGSENIDGARVNVHSVTDLDNGGESWATFACATDRTLGDGCRGKIEPGRATFAVYLSPEVTEILGQMVLYFGAREGFDGQVVVGDGRVDVPAVVDDGRCTEDDIRVVRERLIVDCDLDFDAAVRVMDLNDLIESINRVTLFSNNESVDMSMYGRGWHWVTMRVIAGMQSIRSEFLYCVSECVTDLGAPPMPITVDNGSFIVDARSLVAPACIAESSESVEAVPVTGSFRRMSGGIYRLDESTVLEMETEPGEMFSREIVGDGGVDVIVAVENVCDPYLMSLRVAYVVSPLGAEERTATPDVGTAPAIDGLALLASPDAPAAVAIAADATRVVIESLDTDVASLDAAAIRFDDGPWIPVSFARLVGLSVPKNATKMSIRTRGVDGTRIVTREVVREAAAGVVVATETRPEVQVISPDSGASGGVPVWVWVLVALAVIGLGAGVAQVRLRRKAPVAG